MKDIQELELRIDELERRLKQVEDWFGAKTTTNDHRWEDELFEMAREVVIRHKKASPVFLQRKLMIDLHRAIGLLRQLEAAGVIGPANGSKPGRVLIDDSGSRLGTNAREREV